jgi:hypothetical protein
MTRRAHSQELDFRLMRRGMTPRNMQRGPIDHDLKDGLGRIALSVFIDCSNAGVPFQEALLAVYLTGLENGSSAQKERTNAGPQE